MSNVLIDKAIPVKNKLEIRLNKIIKDFELKTKTLILLDVKENKLTLGIAVDLDKSTF
jgi:hypothetical protein